MHTLMNYKNTTNSNKLKSSLLALAAVMALGGSALAHAQQPGGPQHDQRDQRDQKDQHDQHDQRGDHGPGGHYEFRDADRDQLRKHYAGDFKRVDRDHRPDFRPGQPMPQDFRGRIKPVPADVRRGLPPPPRGYQMGYYGGYAVVYDPVSFAVLQVLDILR